MIMVLRWITALTPPLKPNLVQLIPKIIEALETKAQVTSYNRKLYLSIENKVRRKTTWEQNLPSKMDMDPKYESEYHPSPCLTHSKKVSQIGECLLCEALGENFSSLLCRWEILQGYHLIMHQDPDVVHVYLNLFGTMYLHWISRNIYFTLIFTPNNCV